MNPIDTCRDAFLAFLAQGMTHAEAYDQFDDKELRAAMRAELEGGLFIDPDTEQLVNEDRKPSLLDLISLAQYQKRSIRDFEQQAIPLMLAGWTIDTPPDKYSNAEGWLQRQTMSLYWRAPGKRPGKPGRRYLSTQQAFNAMQRAQK